MLHINQYQQLTAITYQPLAGLFSY